MLTLAVSMPNLATLALGMAPGQGEVEFPPPRRLESEFPLVQVARL